MDKKKIRFITNPFSGNKSKADLKLNIDTFLDHSIFDYDITYTEFPKHATTLSLEAKEAGYYAVIAVGGDGTINEVASALVHSNTALGIIPFGSGNGFSYHIGIRRSIIRAIETINTGYLEKIDTGLANGRFFY
ncbi:MAG: acylglycerol kinase family protein [Saprospiraceae bacterium]|nr:acylglycerol kinase family protein [Saprospiraceae bacterium]